MAKFLSLFLFLVAFGALLKAEGIFPQPSPQLHLSGREQVELYATTWCGYCAKTRRFFAEQHIPYKEWDVENSAVGRERYEKMGGGAVPIIVINGNQLIRGFDPEAISEALSSPP